MKKSLKKWGVFILMGMYSFTRGWAQESIIVKGKVTDANTGEVLPWVNILVKGTSRGTASDNEGNYEIAVQPGETLLFLYIGYQNKEVTVGKQQQINVALEPGASLEEVVVVGTRAKARTDVESPVPIDVINLRTISVANPQTTVGDILNYVAPSFTSNYQTVADGTDHINPATLRGLGPDQMLVLINGKRRHPSALMNVNGTIGRGSVGTDLNAIPSAAVERIEVLRDGAAAQYGSDAIAGIINVVLQKRVNTISAKLHQGAYIGKHADGYNQNGLDGQKMQLDLNYGIPLGAKGYINFTGSMLKRNGTIRSYAMGQPIYLGIHAIERHARAAGFDVSKFYKMNNATDRSDALNAIAMYVHKVEYWDDAFKNQIKTWAQNGELDSLRKYLAEDVTEEELARRNKTRKDFRMKIGQSELTEGKFFFNSAYSVNDNTEFYGFGGISYRRGLAAGFYRRPAYTDGRGNTAAFPDGFLPHIGTDINDHSLSIGIQSKVAEWNVDFSNTYGRNGFHFNIVNTSNATLLGRTKTDFDAGGFSFVQNTTNFDVNRFFNIMNGVNMAWGVEYRVENYRLMAGEDASWMTYDRLGNGYESVGKIPDSNRITSFFGRSVPGGSQVFPGFRPVNEVNKYRTSYAGYLDVEADITHKFLLSGAIRYENYSDFGNTLNWKVAGRYKVLDHLNIRGAVSTGFRAPSLHQIYFNTVSTQFIGGIPYEVGTFNNESRLARLLDIPKLKEETSLNAAGGISLKVPSLNITASIDAFQITVKDRIVLPWAPFTDPQDGSAVSKAMKEVGAVKATFLMNAIDTRTTGIDIVVSHTAFWGEKSSLHNELAINTFTTDTLEVHIPGKLQSFKSKIFMDADYIFLARAMPNEKGSLTHFLTLGNFTLMLRNTYFGKVTDPDKHGTDANGHIIHSTYGAKVITDASIAYQLNDNFSVTLGANNLLDVYPDEVPEAFNYGGQFRFSRRVSQFGFNGRYVFGKVELTLSKQTK